jgi:hypothetical protein
LCSLGHYCQCRAKTWGMCVARVRAPQTADNMNGGWPMRRMRSHLGPQQRAVAHTCSLAADLVRAQALAAAALTAQQWGHHAGAAHALGLHGLVQIGGAVPEGRGPLHQPRAGDGIGEGGQPCAGWEACTAWARMARAAQLVSGGRRRPRVQVVLSKQHAPTNEVQEGPEAAILQVVHRCQARRGPDVPEGGKTASVQATRAGAAGRKRARAGTWMWCGEVDRAARGACMINVTAPAL